MADQVTDEKAEADQPRSAEPPYCPCAGQCHHSKSPCSFGCLAAAQALSAQPDRYTAYGAGEMIVKWPSAQPDEGLLSDFTHMARFRHDEAHNGGIYHGGEFPCDLCPQSLIRALAANERQTDDR